MALGLVFWRNGTYRCLNAWKSSGLIVPAAHVRTIQDRENLFEICFKGLKVYLVEGFRMSNKSSTKF